MLKVTRLVSGLDGSISLVCDEGWEIAGSFQTDKDGWALLVVLTKNSSELSNEDAVELVQAAADEYTWGEGGRTVVEVELADLLGRVVWTDEMIRAKLLSDQAWVERGLVAIYKRQTELERSSEQTIFRNGVGFGAFDARMGSYLAKWCLGKKRLSGEFLVKGRRIVLKYVGQLVEVANSGSAEGGA